MKLSKIITVLLVNFCGGVAAARPPLGTPVVTPVETGKISRGEALYYGPAGGIVSSFIDKERGVICYVVEAAISGGGTGISCVPLAETATGR